MRSQFLNLVKQASPLPDSGRLKTRLVTLIREAR